MESESLEITGLEIPRDHYFIKGENLGRKPRNAEFMTYSEIVGYAIDTYPIIKLQTAGSDETDNRKKYIIIF